jgi:hypothetical protein
MISLGGSGQRTGKGAAGSGTIASNEGKPAGVEGDVDQVERFLNLVDWGNVPKPSGWEEEGAFDDAPESSHGEGEVDDINSLAERLGAVEVTTSDPDR